MFNKALYAVLFALLTIGSLIMSLGGSPFYIMMTVMNASSFLACALYPKRICILPILIGAAIMIYMLVSMLRLAYAW